MGFPKSLYLNDRFFYAMAVCVALFLLSYTLAPVFYLALAALATIAALLMAECISLYRTRNIDVTRSVDAVLSLNDDNAVKIQLANKTPVARKIRIIDELPWQFNRRNLSHATRIGPNTSETWSYTLKPLVRGEYEFGDVHVFVSTLAGFSARRETTPAARTVAVYPSIALMARQELAALHHPLFSAGENRNRRLGQSYEFDQVRSYVPGDDTRHINWKASSTLREIMVNTYEDERSQQIYSVIDKSRVMKTPFGGLPLADHAINATLAFSNVVLRKQDKAGLVIFSKTLGASIKADRGRRQLRKIMHGLYKEQYDFSEADYEQLYVHIRRTIPNRSLLFLYTNFDSLHGLERNLRVLRMLARYHLLVVVFFKNAELEEYASGEAATVLDIYQLTIARRFLHEKQQIARELRRHGILSLQCIPDQLSTATINKYLELKARGHI